MIQALPYLSAKEVTSRRCAACLVVHDVLLALMLNEPIKLTSAEHRLFEPRHIDFPLEGLLIFTCIVDKPARRVRLTDERFGHSCSVVIVG